jgi:ribosomal protein S18 acetylase RimI-like enzyme
MYARYLRETLGLETLEDSENRGFLTYGFNCIPGVDFPHCYIQDLWVAPEHRQNHVAASLADRAAGIAKKAGIRMLFGSVCGTSKDPDRSAKVLVAYGMKLYSIGDNVAYYVKEIT